MRRSVLLLFGLIAIGSTGCAVRASVAASGLASDQPETRRPFRALVFSKTAGYRHSSIPNAITAIQALGAQHGFTVDDTENAAVFTDTALAKYQVVIFASTTGNVLDDAQQSALERFIRAGKGYVGIHSASDTEYDWPWYGALVGAYFAGHGAVESAHLTVADRAHPSTAALPQPWVRIDEWYHFRSNPRERVHVLLTLDESRTRTSRGAMGIDHPIAWCQEYDGGRSFYTAGGHTSESFAEPLFLDHLLKGIQTAAGVRAANCRASQTSQFEKTTVASDPRAPMDLDVAADGRVVYVEKNGGVRVVNPTGSNLNVFSGHEFGLLGLALDPGFMRNGWVYVYYSPVGSRPVDRVSRFTMQGDTLVMTSEVVVLEIDVQREQCCHAGGALLFDSKGNLWIGTGDNTNPFESDGYSPLDERQGRAAWDAQRTSANSNNLSGKLLRVTPQPDGTYRIPTGNLFAAGTPRTRPEIYGMGFRNPFTLGLDPATNRIFVADYGPDAGQTDSLRGPEGRVEWTVIDRPGFYGWPYCVGENVPYHDYDFATKQPGAAFDCANGPVNDSPNNTGINKLPPAITATAWMGRRSGTVRAVGASGAPMTGGAYRFNPALKSARKWPAYWDGTAIFADWNNGRLFGLQLDSSGTRVAGANRIFEGMGIHKPHRLKFGRDGALYLIDWGKGWSGTDSAGVYRIGYAPGKPNPTVLAQQPPATPAATAPTAATTTAAATLAQPIATSPAPMATAPACTGGQRDDFTGTALSRSRWTTVVRETQDIRVAGSHLVIPTTNTDLYSSTNDAPNIVLQPLPPGPFVATAKVTLAARRGYQQAGLVIYGDDDNYAKMVLQARKAQSDDPAARIFQFIREESGSPNEVGESNTAPLGAEYPDTVWVRFSSDGKNLRAAYSADGVTFIGMPQTKSLEGMAAPKIGLISLSSGFSSAPVIDAKFDWFQLCQPGAQGAATETPPATRPAATRMPARASAPPASRPPPSTAAPLAASTVLAGVYTVAQANRGEQIFKTSCAKCHLTERFTGPTFQQTWTGQPIHTLFERMRAAMPMDKPGSLSRTQYAAVVAYMLKLNAYPAGTTELPSADAALKRIRFERRPANGN